MIFHVLTIFPAFVEGAFDYGVLRRARETGIVKANVRDLRDWAEGAHRSVDDVPYGGGPGMVMMCDPVYRAVEELRADFGPLPLIYLSPTGERFTHKQADQLAHGGDFILLCGRYEGIDQRIVDELVDLELSVGDYVLSGAELAAMTVIDTVARLLPGVVGNAESLAAESFTNGLLDYPHYTRPENFRGMCVPEVLLSGHHAKISAFRQKAALLLTYRRRPELLSTEQRAEAERLLDNASPEGASNADEDR